MVLQLSRTLQKGISVTVRPLFIPKSEFHHAGHGDGTRIDDHQRRSEPQKNRKDPDLSEAEGRTDGREHVCADVAVVHELFQECTWCFCAAVFHLSSLHGCNFPSLSPCGEQTVSIATGCEFFEFS